VTTSVIAEACVIEPLVAEMVNGYEPGLVDVEVLSASCDEPAVVIVPGVKVAPTDAGRPPTDSETSPVKPFSAVTPTE